MRLLVAVASVAVASVAVASVVVAAAATAVMVAITITVTVSVGTAAAVAPAPLRHTRSTRTCSALMVLVRLVKIQGWWFSILALLSPGKKKALALGRDSSLRPCNGARPPLRRRQCRGCTPLLPQRLLPPTRLPQHRRWCETAARSARWSQGLRESTSTGCTCAASPSTSPTRRWRRHLSSCARSSCIVTCDVSATLHCKIFV